MQFMADKERRATPRWRPTLLALAVLVTLAAGMLFIGAVSTRPTNGTAAHGGAVLLAASGGAVIPPDAELPRRARRRQPAHRQV